jgi:ABC-type nitrate/sulfonate/bicarbonate transport system, ATPase component
VNGRSIIEAQAVRKVFPGKHGVTALERVDVDIPAGRFISILGPSGCGKSTFLRCVGGIERITSGSLRVRGREVNGPPEGIGFVFQRDALLEWRNIRRNLLLPVEFARKPLAQYRDKVEELLAMTGLADFADRYPHQLSGGMRQRAAICRALIDDPDLLLMDEPFGALDAITRDQMNIELQRIWMSTRNTVLFVTHGIAEAVFLGDEVMVFSPRPGRIARTLRIDLPRPRPLSIRETKAFGDYVAEIRDLFQQMGIFKERDNAPASGNLMEGKA